jgi:hypothetical protein
MSFNIIRLIVTVALFAAVARADDAAGLGDVESSLVDLQLPEELSSCPLDKGFGNVRCLVNLCSPCRVPERSYVTFG